MNARVRLLDERGDLSAPPGTREWALAVRLEIQGLLKDAESSVRHVQRWLKAMQEHDGYRTLTDATGESFGTFRAFVVAAPPFGLGYEPGVIDHLLREEHDRTVAEVLADAPALAEPHRPPADKPKQIRVKQHGTSADYLAARIKRDRPDIAERMKGGEFRSVRAAAIEAGIVRPPTPIEQALKLLPKLTEGERQLLRDAIDAMAEEG